MGSFLRRPRFPTKPSPRGVLLRKLGERPHRYRARRAFAQTISISILALIPLLGVARFDLWRGAHRALGRPVNGVLGLTAVLTGIAGLYLVTFLFNFVAGRLFCGWGCPVGQLSRAGEAMEEAVRSGRGLQWARFRGGLFALALSVSIILWWVDPALFWRGTPGEIIAGLGAVLLLALLAYLHGRFWRWSFCRKVCPIGLYYSVVHVPGIWRIRFDRALGTCKECRACARICPVGLDPRELSRPEVGIGGLAIDGLPADHHCLRCADCVAACEFIFEKDPEKALPLRFGLPGGGARRAPPPPLKSP